jgi:hypothetical protein
MPQFDSPLTPELKEFIDRAIVPVLVRQYLSASEKENIVADEAHRAAHSVTDFIRNTAAANRSRR